MCIIIFKKGGVDMPSNKVLANCFSNNSDGAGFAIVRDGHVHIRKGFMTLHSLMTALEEEHVNFHTTIGIHFRIRTSGNTDAHMCHPFPVSQHRNDLRDLDIYAPTALLHNGIIGAGEGELSDTAVFVRDILAHDFVQHHLLNGCEKALSYIEDMTSTSRLCILNNDGRYFLTGDWVEEDGLMYSNKTYKYDYSSWRSTNVKPYSGKYWDYGYNKTYDTGATQSLTAYTPNELDTLNKIMMDDEPVEDVPCNECEYDICCPECGEMCDLQGPQEHHWFCWQCEKWHHEDACVEAYDLFYENNDVIDNPTQEEVNKILETMEG